MIKMFTKYVINFRVGSFVVLKSSKHQLANKLHALELLQRKAVQGLIFLNSARLSAISKKKIKGVKMYLSFYYCHKLKMKVFGLVIHSLAIKNYPLL